MWAAPGAKTPADENLSLAVEQHCADPRPKGKVGRLLRFFAVHGVPYYSKAFVVANAETGTRVIFLPSNFLIQADNRAMVAG